MADSNSAITPLLSYAAISCALLIPVLVWPLQGMGGGSIEFSSAWIITASILLVSSVTADSILYHRANSLSPFFATVWILGTSFVVSVALRADIGPYMLAVMFSLHSIRSGYRLWRNDQAWWLWPACLRDGVAAAILFGWIILLSGMPA